MVRAALDERRSPDLCRYLRARVAGIVPAYHAALIGSIGLLRGLGGTPGLRLSGRRAAAVLRVRAEHLAGERPEAQPALDPVLATLVALVPTVAVSALSWLALERPVIAWGARRNERSRTQRRGAERRASGGGVDRPSARREVGALRAY